LTVTWLGTGCVSKPTMRLNHAEITGVRIALPPRLGILMKLYVDVYNPNSYDVAVRAVRGQVLLAQRYTLLVDFRAEGEGVWLPSGATTTVAVPVDVPIDLGLAVVRESFSTLTIPYHFTGRADVTASRSLKLEADDYSVNADGGVSRQQLEMVLRGGL
jgi:hypothetical protein